LRPRQPADLGIETLKFGRPDADAHDAGKRAFRRRPAPADGEELIGRQTGIAGNQNLADVGAGVLLDLNSEIIAIRGAQLPRHRIEQAGNERMPIAIEQHDRLDLRRGIVDRFELEVIRRLVRKDALVRNVPKQLRDVEEREVDRLEHFRGMLVHDLERAFDPLVGGLLRRKIIAPGRIGEQHERQNHRPGDRQVQEPQCCALCRPHVRFRVRKYLPQARGELPRLPKARYLQEVHGATPRPPLQPPCIPLGKMQMSRNGAQGKRRN